MTRIAPLLLLAGLLGVPAPSQEPSPVIPLRVLYVGGAEGRRTEDFTSFLERRFARAAATSRKAFDPGAVKDVDVVLLDWPQRTPGEEWPLPSTPLGERKEWRIPTVLLGSAGLKVSRAWNVKGWFG